MFDWDEVIGDHPALGAIPAALRKAVRRRTFARGETLFRQGERPGAMLYVLTGEIRLVRYSPDGGEIILQRSQGGFLAEASLDAAAYHCDVVAAAGGELLMFPRTPFQTALDNDAAFSRSWIGLLAREVRRLRARSERLSLNSAAERILHYLEAEGVDGTVTLTQSRKAWAGELGLSHEALYRALRDLREGGVLEVDGERISRKIKG